MESQKLQNHVLYTIGHSTRPFEEFVEMLKAHHICALADVRSMPGSRRLPQYNADAMAEALPAHSVAYLPWKSLGGRRRPLKDSINTGWHHPAFRGYADYMATPEFNESLKELLGLATHQPTVIMCAEAVPWRCHRNLVADAAVLLHGWEVRHIMTQARYDVHKPRPFARIAGHHLEYPADDLFAPGAVTSPSAGNDPGLT